jgi:hypothetical protein
MLGDVRMGQKLKMNVFCNARKKGILESEEKVTNCWGGKGTILEQKDFIV